MKIFPNVFIFVCEMVSLVHSLFRVVAQRPHAEALRGPSSQLDASCLGLPVGLGAAGHGLLVI